VHECDDVFLKDTTTWRNVLAGSTGPLVTVMSSSEHGPPAAAGVDGPGAGTGLGVELTVTVTVTGGGVDEGGAATELDDELVCVDGDDMAGVVPCGEHPATNTTASAGNIRFMSHSSPCRVDHSCSSAFTVRWRLTRADRPTGRKSFPRGLLCLNVTGVELNHLNVGDLVPVEALLPGEAITDVNGGGQHYKVLESKCVCDGCVVLELESKADDRFRVIEKSFPTGYEVGRSYLRHW
jgi:hypothetical protein